MTDATLLFSQAGMYERLAAQSEAGFDTLPFGVIGFDAETMVRAYNSFEMEAAGLSLSRVVGQPLFTVVAPCMNNYMVAQRYEDALAGASDLDATIDYVLTLRMRPIPVQLRMLARPGMPMRYLLVNRSRS